MNDTEANGVSSGSSKLSSSSKKDFAQLNLFFKAVSTVFPLATLLVLTYSALPESDRSQRILEFRIIAIGILAVVVLILGSVFYAIHRSRKLPYEKDFAQHNLLFNAIYSVATLFAFVLLGYSAVLDANQTLSTAELRIIIIAMAVAILSILGSVVYVLHKSK